MTEMAIDWTNFDAKIATVELPPGACPTCGGEGQVPDLQNLDDGPLAESCGACSGTGDAARSNDPVVLRAEIARLKVDHVEAIGIAVNIGYTLAIGAVNEMKGAPSTHQSVRDVLDMVIATLQDPQVRGGLSMVTMATVSTQDLRGVLKIIQDKMGGS